MQSVTVQKKDLYMMIKKAVREVLQEKTSKYFLKNLPAVSEDEMADIKTLYKKPAGRKKPAFSETVEI